MKKITEEGVQYLAPRMKMVTLRHRSKILVNSKVNGTADINPWEEDGEDKAED